MLIFLMELKEKQKNKKNKAINICLDKNETLTQNRLLILNILLGSEIPI